MDENSDPVIKGFREQISDNDRALVEAVNERLRLVGRLKSYKQSKGIEFVDPEREEWMLQDVTRASRGPISVDGLREIYGQILELTKRELARDEDGGPQNGP